MRTHLGWITAAALVILPATAFAQAADDHHPTDAGATPAPAAAGLPAQCAAMMPMMQQMMQMMSMMQGQGGMTQGMPMGTGMMSDATKAYMNAMSMMDAPMMMGAQASDPDVAFVKAMIPHHQGAIDMAKAVLQYGKDDKVKGWAAEIIKAQEAEITQMQAWLKEHGQ